MRTSRSKQFGKSAGCPGTVQMEGEVRDLQEGEGRGDVGAAGPPLLCGCAGR